MTHRVSQELLLLEHSNILRETGTIEFIYRKTHEINQMVNSWSILIVAFCASAIEINILKSCQSKKSIRIKSLLLLPLLSLLVSRSSSPFIGHSQTNCCNTALSDMVFQSSHYIGNKYGLLAQALVGTKCNIGIVQASRYKPCDMATLR